jgi:hypothetical protein
LRQLPSGDKIQKKGVIDMSKVGDLTAFLKGTHRLGTEDGLRDYHAARSVMKAKRIKHFGKQNIAIGDALRPYRVVGFNNGDTLRLIRSDTNQELTI